MRCLALVMSALLVLVGCSGDSDSRQVQEDPRAAEVEAAGAALPVAALPADALPIDGAYVGSRVCQECHEGKFRRWSESWHAKALTRASAETVAGDFDDAHYSGASSEAWMKRSGADFIMRTRDMEGDLHDYPVQWLIGGKRMQDGVTVFPDGRWQVLPVYYHVTGSEWVDYNEKKQGVVTADNPYFWTNFRRTANHECLSCHTTGLSVRYEEQDHQWVTEFADSGVACESCHGPGARHARTEDPADVVHPGRVDPELALAICGQCHGPRVPLFPLLDPGHQFRPGQPYEDSFRALEVVEGRNRSGEYFADGKPSSSSFEYQSLLQSRCYRVGGATCLSCHSAPHDPHGANDLPVNPGLAVAPDAAQVADSTCRSCHAEFFAKRQEHTHHLQAAAQSCVACHMPRLLSGVLDSFADHALDVPAPQNSISHGVPNACNVCHSAETPAAMVEAMQRWWPDATRRQARRIRLAAAIDEATAAQSETPLAEVVADLDEAPTLRGAAAIFLAQRFPARVSGLVGPQLGDVEPKLRARFIEALGHAGARDQADLVATFRHDPSLSVRLAAALILDSFGDPRGFDALRDLATAKESEGLSRPHLRLSVWLARRGQFDEAEEQLRVALAQMPYLSDAWMALADLEARKGQFDAAREDLLEALRFDPQHRGALQRMAALEGNPPS